MKNLLLNLYRSLPWFKGKLRLGKFLFKGKINKSKPVVFKAHKQILYKVPNTLENIGIELLINGVYEQDIIKFLITRVKEHEIFFDVGANIGSIGLPVVKQVPTVMYYGFEASPMVFDFLHYNFEVNRIKHYKLINKLVHKDSELAMQFYQADLYGKSSLAPTYSNNAIIVGSLSIDDFCDRNNIEIIDWMKVDVQGFEVFVFEGMNSLLKNKRIKNILFEVEEWAEDQAGVQKGAAVQYIVDCGYELHSIDGKKWENNKGTETMIWARPSQ